MECFIETPDLNMEFNKSKRKKCLTIVVANSKIAAIFLFMILDEVSSFPPQKHFLIRSS